MGIPPGSSEGSEVHRTLPLVLSRGLSRHTTASTPSGGMPGRAGGVAPGGRTATHPESTLYRIIERTGRGGADAKGVKFGRKPKLTPHQQREALERLAQDETQRSVARGYTVSQATISRLRAGGRA